ncbi:MAG TPA: glycoside hydrolase TIM-barrel-like domain-containing protein [Rhizomicrobium sp.]|jgi:hypothetical protein
MASLVLGLAGSALGAGLGSFSLFGVAVSGAEIGGFIGTAVGGIVDQMLFGQTTSQKGPRLTDTNITTSTEGTPIPRIDGYIRIAGQLIWRTKYKEKKKTESSGGKGFGGGTQTTTYSYSISIAIGLCEGVVHKLGRIWADGQLIDASKLTLRFYQGTEDQLPDPLTEEIEGDGNNPAYRGHCYVVFEDLDLTPFGNRIPQLQFELVRSITADRADALENVLVGVNLIPGAGEFVYQTDVISTDDGAGTTSTQNKNNSDGIADYVSSMNDLQAIAPNVQTVSLVVGWFGSDERAGSCLIKPKVETHDKQTYPKSWTVNGLSRGDAEEVSQVGGRPSYGGTPSDDGVVQAIADLKSRGYRVTFYPFLFMDIASGNSLPDPYSDNASTTGQPAFPWRGRITCSPAAGFAGTVDQTSTATTQVDAFFGNASSSDYSVSGTSVSWTGGDDWGWRRMVLHYAKLCVAAGGVETFIIGSELRGLTRVRSDATTYPAVAALKTLAADVKAIVGSGCKVSYAADWSEYNNHQTGDAAGAVLFNLDPLWSDSHIDFVGIDNYMPLADWRDGGGLDYDAVNGPTSIYGRAYLQANIKGGEGYDWYYPSSGATGNEASPERIAQTRTAITDGVADKPWVFRPKDLWNWWSNAHYDRPDGSESGTATDWVSESKPIRFTELGCPAVNKGANQPNVFVDPKSSESFLPYFSTGERDDLMQRAFLEAHLNYWPLSANNPTSTVYGAPMLDFDSTSVWCWDARPFPFFPQRSDLWADCANYDLGHWLNGRLGAVLLSDLVAEICDYNGFEDYDVSNLSGIVTGFMRNSTMSGRDEISPLMTAFFFDAVESQGLIKFVMRGQPNVTEIDEGDLVVDPESDQNFSFTFTDAQTDDLPLAWRFTFIDAGNDYQQGVYQAKRLVGNSNRIDQVSLPFVMDRSQMGGIGDRLIQEAWTSRGTGAFSLPPLFTALDPADEIVITAGTRTRRMRVTEINDTASRAISATVTDPSIYEAFTGPARSTHPVILPLDTGRDLVVFADLPMLTDDAVAWSPYVGAFGAPWPGQVLIFRSATDTNYQLDTAIPTAASIGVTLLDFYSGPAWRWDRVNELNVELYDGTLSSASDDITVFGGANALAIENADGRWEIVQFETAELIGSGQWKLTNLLRGQRGTEAQMRDPVAAGARVLVLDTTLLQLDLAQNEFNLAFNYLWGPQDKDISDPAYQSGAFTFAGVGLRPFSPCQLDAVYDASGDLLLTWLRRDRSPDADSWDQTEIPMSEQSESYDVDILDGAGAVKRTFAALSSAAATYTAGEIASDFPSGLPSPFRFTVYQNSSKIGRGTPASASILFS